MLDKKNQEIPIDFEKIFESELNIYYKNKKMYKLDEKDFINSILKLEIEILKELNQDILNNFELINDLWEKIGDFDIILTFIKISLKNNWICPKFDENKRFYIKNGKNPLLNNNLSIISNSTYFENSKIQIITGLNSSGKSTYLIQIGLIIILSHIGCFIPVEDSSIPIFSSISTLFHFSTNIDVYSSSFLTEINYLSNIIDNSSKNSLILIDEFGRTSNPEEGFSILCGFIKYMSIKENECPYIVISTYFYSLLHPPMIDNKIFESYYMEYLLKDENIINTFKLIQNQYNNNFSLNIVENFGIPKEICERSKIILKKLENNELIEPLEINNNFLKYKKLLKIFFKWKENENPIKILNFIEENL